MFFKQKIINLNLDLVFPKKKDSCVLVLTNYICFHIVFLRVTFCPTILFFFYCLLFLIIMYIVYYTYCI